MSYATALGALVWALASNRPAPAAAADPYASSFAEAARLERASRFAAAARVLEDALPEYPQDYALVLQAAWMRFLAGHYRRAAGHYRRAIELSGGSIDSRLGLTWSLLYDGHKSEAVAELEALSAEHPADPDVRVALQTARNRSPVRVAPWASATGHVYADHPDLERGIGTHLGLSMSVREHALFAASYAFAWITTDAVGVSTSAGQGPGPGGPDGTDPVDGTDAGSMGQMGGMGSPGRVRGEGILQHQVHASAGATWPIAGAVLQYGYLHGATLLPDIHAIGTSARYSPYGDIGLDVSLTLGTEAPVPRIAPSWRIPIAHHVWLRPAAALQVVDGDALPVGMLTVGLRGKPGTVWVGGKYGRERNPAYLDVPVIFNVAGAIHWGAWLGGSLNLPAGFRLFGGYEVHGLEVDDALSGRSDPAQAHYVTLGLGWSPS